MGKFAAWPHGGLLILWWRPKMLHEIQESSHLVLSTDWDPSKVSRDEMDIWKLCQFPFEFLVWEVCADVCDAQILI